MEERSFEHRLAMLIESIRKASPTDPSIGLPRTGKEDELDRLADAVDDLLRRSRESAEAFQKAREALLKLQNPDEKADAELTRDRTLLMDALEANIPDKVYFKDTQGRFLHLSNSHLKGTHLKSLEDAIGKTDFDLFTEEHARAAWEDEQRIIRTGEPIVNKEEKETWPDGPDTWVLTTKMPLRDRNGVIVGTFGISHDITERKRTEEALRTSEERYRLLFSSINDAVFVHKLTPEGLPGRFTDVNDIACERLGYTREELLRMSPLDIDSPEGAAVAPAMMIALKANRLANCHGRGSPARQAPASRKVMKLARFWTAASRARYLPRNGAGTSAVIHGSHAQLEMPRDRLKQNSSISISARQLSGFRKMLVSGTSAIAKINMTRVPQPA